MFVFTSCTNNYIPKARVLASTLKSFHPDWTFCLLLGETPPADFCLDNEPFDRVQEFDGLGIPEYPAWLFRHRVVEICTAAKGPALQYFLEIEQHDKVLYLDPDIMVCNSLAPLEALLDEHDVLLTPHQLAPQETVQSVQDNELCALCYGVFNLGFVAAARRGQGIAFARWWRDRLLVYCYDDIPNGLFTDQRWCDLAPAFFSRLHIVRDAGCNAASWNLTDRTISRTPDGVFMANAGPLRFYHFTGFDSGAGTSMTERYARNMPAVHELWALYTQRLAAAGHEQLGKLRWAHTTFADGTPITDSMRLLYRNREDLQRAFPDPFVVPGYLHWYRTEGQKDVRSLQGRIRNKLGSLRRLALKQIALNGGFPRALPRMAHKVVNLTRRYGLRRVLRAVWRGESLPQTEPLKPAPALPSLQQLLQDTGSLHTLQRMLAPEVHPVCMVEHDWGGGAAVYSERRIAALLAEGRAVVRLRYVFANERLEMTVRSGDETLLCTLDLVWDLADARMPHLQELVINELAGWYTRPGIAVRDVALNIEDSVRALTEVARLHKAHIEYLFHDFFAVCPSFNLLKADKSHCDLSLAEDCTNCLGQRAGNAFSMLAWRTVWGALLAQADKVVFFSENTRNLVQRVYALRDEQVLVQPHEIPDFGRTLSIPSDGPMRIAVVGNIQLHKGAEIVGQLAALLQQQCPEASIVIFGQLELDTVPGNVTVLGSYVHAELPDLLEKNKITVGLFPSIWPETFSFVTHELASLSLPLVCFDLGAPGSFVAGLSNSLVVHEVSAEAAFAALCTLDTRRIKTEVCL